jgi:hypothetical protein
MDHEWLREQEEEMNNCPRKELGYYTPLEVKELWGKSVVSQISSTSSRAAKVCENAGL